MPRIKSFETKLENVSSTFGVKWTVKKFEALPSVPGSYIDSCNLSDNVGHSHWYLMLYPGGEKDKGRGHISVFLNLESKEPVMVNFVIQLLNCDGQVYHQRGSIRQFSEANFSYGWSTFFPRKTLFRERDTLLSGGDLTLRCQVTIESKALEKYPTAEYRLSSALRTSGNYDLTLVPSDGGQISVHRLVLQTASPVFAAMFAHDTKEKHEAQVDTKDFKRDTLQLLVDYAYEGTLHFEIISFDTLAELLIAADKYQMETLIKQCTRHLASRLAPSTAARLLAIADRLNLEHLYTDVIQLIKKNPLSVMTSPEWIQLTEQNQLLKKAFLALAN